MDEKPLWLRSASALADAVRTRQLSPLNLVDAFLDRIEDVNPSINAYVTLLGEEARERARDLEARVDSGGDPGPLAGVPVALKDLYGFKEGVRHTFGSVPFEEYVAPRSAVAVERLERAGAVVLGKTNTPEFGHKALTDNLLFGRTANPFDRSKICGGSSGGSAAAVAAGMTCLGQGSDTGGSVRIPASACGLFGFKPTFGTVPFVSRPRGFAEHSPFTCLGPLTRGVADAARMMDVMSGPHPGDPFSLPAQERSFESALGDSTGSMSVAYSPDLGWYPVHSEVRSTLEEALDQIRERVDTIERVELDLPFDPEELQSAYTRVFWVKVAALAEDLERDHGVEPTGKDRSRMTRGLVRMMEAGASLSGPEYHRADRLRTAWYDRVQHLFERYDLLVTPTLALPPFDEEEAPPSSVEGTEIDPGLGWFLTWPFNLTGHPAASLPAGESGAGLPIGMQVIAPRLQDASIFAFARTLEEHVPWSRSYERLISSGE